MPISSPSPLNRNVIFPLQQRSHLPHPLQSLSPSLLCKDPVLTPAISLALKLRTLAVFSVEYWRIVHFCFFSYFLLYFANELMWLTYVICGIFRFQIAKPIILDPGLYMTKKADVFWVTQRRSVPTAFKHFTSSQGEARCKFFIWADILQLVEGNIVT